MRAVLITWQGSNHVTSLGPTSHGVHQGLAGEHVLDKAVLLVLLELVPAGGDHACRVLATMLQHQQALVQLSIHVAFVFKNANDATHAHSRPVGWVWGKGEQDSVQKGEGVMVSFFGVLRAPPPRTPLLHPSLSLPNPSQSTL